MPDVDSASYAAVADDVEFVAAGVRVKGEFHCTQCGYGVTVYRALPVCPMCGSEEWEKSDWSPLARARGALQ
jgi:rubrerythrin